MWTILYSKGVGYFISFWKQEENSKKELIQVHLIDMRQRRCPVTGIQLQM